MSNCLFGNLQERSAYAEVTRGQSSVLPLARVAYSAFTEYSADTLAPHRHKFRIGQICHCAGVSPLLFCRRSTALIAHQVKRGNRVLVTSTKDQDNIYIAHSFIERRSVDESNNSASAFSRLIFRAIERPAVRKDRRALFVFIGLKKQRKERQLEKLAYKTTTAAKLGDMSDRFVRQLIYDGKLEAVRVGGEWRIPADAFHKLIGAKKEAQNQVEVSQVAA